MNFKTVVTSLVATSTLFVMAADVFRYDFEKGDGNKLPAYGTHVKGKDEGGTLEIVKDPVGSYTKALKAKVEKGKPDARFLIQKKYLVNPGDILQFEAWVKGTGHAVFGLYGFGKGGSMISYQAVSTPASNSWKKLTKEIAVTKKGMTHIYPFLQCNGGELLFSGFTITKKGIPCGQWEHQQDVRELSWKKKSGEGALSRGEKKGGTYVLNLVSGNASLTAESEKFEGESGDLVCISFKAKGKGKVFPGLFIEGKEGKEEFLPGEEFTLNSDWTDYACDILVKNSIQFVVNALRPAIRLKEGNAEIDGITFFRKTGMYKGDLPFPKQTVVFPLMDAKFQPSEAELCNIPETLNGVKSVTASVFASTIDFAPLMNGVKAGNCAWAFFKLDVPVESDYTIGAGADWWMTVYHNGTEVFDTMASGNRLLNCDILDYTKTIRLKKGSNIFAVKFKSGMNSSVLRLGGPCEIRKYAETLLRNRELAMETFDDTSVRRSSSPEYRKMITKYGDMLQTNVAVYKQNAEITSFEKAFSFSDLQKDELFGQSILLVDFPFSDKAVNHYHFDFKSRNDTLRCTVENDGAKTLVCYFSENGKRTSPKFRLYNAHELLPGDFTLFSDRNGYLTLLFASTRNTNIRPVFRWESSLMKAMAEVPVKVSGAVTVADKQKPVILDDYAVVTGKVKVERSRMPFLLELSPEFDPVKAGWKLAMSDEFNGTEFDWSKWDCSGSQKGKDYIKLDGKGHLVITADWNKDKTKIVTGGIKTKRFFTYGYYEARLKFTKEPGFWSAFWMLSCGTPVSPFYSVEFDFYEDYYTRPLGPGQPYRKILDCTAYAGWRHGYKRPLKIWNYQAEIPGSLDEFYTFGVKWTPLEISYYLNGKKMKGNLKFSPHNTVTWDAFNHCAVACQNQMYLTNNLGLGNPKHGKFPENFVIDYFRAYEYPQNNIPEVKWVEKGSENLIVKKGDTLHLKVDAKPGKSGVKLRGAYLFDNGYFIAKKDTAPYTFDIPMTKEFFDTTQYAVPGLSKGTPMAPPPFDTPFPHTFMVYVQDENGKIAQTTMKRYILDSGRECRPYQGNAQVIPGTVQLNHFDEGGQDTAYYWSSPGGRDQSFRMDEKVYAGKDFIENNDPGNWSKYTVDVKKDGKYDAALYYSCVWKGDVDSWVELLIDGRLAGIFRLENCGEWVAPKYKSILRNIPMKEGRHQLTLIYKMSGFNAKVEFTEAK